MISVMIRRYAVHFTVIAIKLNETVADVCIAVCVCVCVFVCIYITYHRIGDSTKFI